jgi:glycosyltransferase involved in cell wall biosynthesis
MINARKNILILMHNDATQFIDIANQYVTLFDKNKYKVTVAYLSGNPNEETKNRTTSEEILFLNCSKKDISGLKISAIKKLVMLCRSQQFSLVISHRYKATYIMMWVTKFCKIPATIFVMHAMETMNAFHRKLFVSLMRTKNMYFAGVSNAVREDLRKQLFRISDDRIITLYNCIDMKATEDTLLSKKEARNFFHLPENAFIIGTVGRLVPHKDPKNIIYAFSKIKSHLPLAKLLIIGEGALKQELKELTEKLNLQNDVIFTGFTPLAYRYLKALDIFVLSSIEEAFGRVLLEAMIAKVPVIGTRTDGIPEVIGDAGFIVEARDSDMLSSAILKMTRLPELEFSALGEKGYERIKAHFSTDKFKDDFLRLGIC